MMNSIGVKLTLLMGPTIPSPADLPIVEAFESAEVTHNEEGRSAFQMTFKIDRRGPLGLLDYVLNKLPQIKTFNRVILLVSFNLATPKVLIDGIITNIQQVSGEGEDVFLVVTGEDVSVMMDLEEKTVEHPGQPELIIANKILLTYAKYGIIPIVIPPLSIDIPLVINRIPVQRGSDLQYLKQMAARFGYVFYIQQGFRPQMNHAYWGPPKLMKGKPQAALSVNMGAESNVESIYFKNDGLQAKLVNAKIQESTFNMNLPLKTFLSKSISLSKVSSLTQSSSIRKILSEDTNGMSFVGAMIRSQGLTNFSSDAAVKAEGTLDALKYGHLLQTHGVVGVRGAGATNDGLYRVKKVVHKIKKGVYTQDFELSREGTGSSIRIV